IATDGSQILPDRHAPYLYSLINVGVIVYYHGRGRLPLQFTEPALDYPGRNGQAATPPAPYEAGEEAEQFADSGAVVSLRRDRAEIETLARIAHEQQDEVRPLVALLDQRLLYWPAVGTNDPEGSRVLHGWQAAMSDVRRAGALLAGYIVNPGKRSVITLLHTLDVNRPGFDLRILTERDAQPFLADNILFRHLLEPGQRSKVFVDVSQHNQDFYHRDPLNEVCFFYLNPGRSGRQIARVDIPRFVAQDPAAVAAVHALVYDQCRIMGDYPYVLARADEIAVVGYQDHESLDAMIEYAMQRYGVYHAITAKQSAKNVARAGKTRHEV
ncbi:MAG: DNA double-strand break repair nuclease NurA, partial [Chloroflexi bacterium]|nr:DNA double-strand break repair nuclease NurA [Chloroflexota bacterium]